MTVYRREVGRRLKAARISAGFKTQAEAADRLSIAMQENIEPSRIGNYEQGTRLPDPLTMSVLSSIYHVYPSTMYGFSEAPASAEEVQLIDRYRRTDDRGRRAIQGIAAVQPAYAQQIIAADTEPTPQGRP